MAMGLIRRMFLAVWLLAPAPLLAQTLPPDIAASKTLRIGLNTGYAPLEFRDIKTNEVVGFDIDLAREIGKELSVAVTWQDGAFEAMTPALQSDRVDMILSGFYDIPRRRPMFTFIDYLHAGAQFFGLVSATDLKEATDLCGKTVTAGRGSSYPETAKKWSDAHCVAAGKPPITVILDTDVSQGMINIKQDRAQAGVLGLEALPTIVQMEPGVFHQIGQPISSTLMGMAFNKGNEQLRDAVYVVMKKIVADGRYAALISKWKLDFSAYPELSIDQGPAP
jgi:polar amino acid transport system substrate-binding protein